MNAARFDGQVLGQLQHGTSGLMVGYRRHGRQLSGKLTIVYPSDPSGPELNIIQSFLSFLLRLGWIVFQRCIEFVDATLLKKSGIRV